jgi:uncharacterized phage protein (TIGR02218 family)
MRTIPPDLAAHLAGSVTTLCRCWRATRRDGIVVGFTDHDADLVFDGTTFAAASGLDAAEATASLGFAVGGGEVAGAFSNEALSEADLAAGLWDAAEVEVFVVNWQAPDQRLRIAVGEVGEVRRDDGAFTAELRGPASRLNTVHGRIFSPTCDAVLGDARCTVDLTSPSYKGSGTVDGVATNHTFSASGLDGYQEGWFTGGKVTWLTGDNAGAVMEIKFHLNNGAEVSFDLWETMPFDIVVGDSFSVTAGCDKSLATCRDRFNNVPNFRGFPYIPGNDAVTSYANTGDANDGGSKVGAR